MQEVNDVFKDLNATFAADSYPVLGDLRYFRRYNQHLENEFANKLVEAKKKKANLLASKEKLLLENLSTASEIKLLSAFVNITRNSLLIYLCSFMENVFTEYFKSNKVLNRKYSTFIKKRNMESKSKEGKSQESNLDKAIAFLESEGYSKNNWSKGIDYVKNMNTIRNSFAHNYGSSNNQIVKLHSDYKYDFKIVNNQIVLGDRFIAEYIEHIDEFSVKVAKVIYEDKSFLTELIEKYKR